VEDKEAKPPISVLEDSILEDLMPEDSTPEDSMPEEQGNPSNKAENKDKYTDQEAGVRAVRLLNI
jgi:hypothetical protein